ncbi:MULTISPECIES: alpha/beta hydrolase [Arenibacter]|uniref:alpha/beta fold hydrolase n=1 Tax=Arenibacter TaxID=178469 RepID=UPI001C065E19|nr:MULTISPECIES: alpha/beta hydrolase [Arenibacter]MBU2906014.1 alpha/beta hydrolase [Arenibacter algicola]MCK0134596.1 alpha/beta hydrolase [Arenibacter sp. S6351L]
MISYNIHSHDTSTKWVTFVHGAGGSSTIWYKQLREFKKHFNVLLLDLRGHGNSKIHLKDAFKNKYTFDNITEDILEVINFEKIEKSHFIGISLGTILIRNLAEKHPHRVESMIMGGAIMKLNLRSQILMRLGVILKSIVPYLWLYKFFAFVIMPNKNHKESRLLFVREAKKLYQKEFIRWFKLTSEINPLLHFFRTVDIKIPTLYVMGAEDYLFLPTIKQIVLDHKSAELIVVQNCGHVVNVEQPRFFNDTVIQYLLVK